MRYQHNFSPNAVWSANENSPSEYDDNDVKAMLILMIMVVMVMIVVVMVVVMMMVVMM